jgi:hypothetical protein
MERKEIGKFSCPKAQPIGQANSRIAQADLELTIRLIVRISSSIMSQSMFDTYSNRVQDTTIPAYKAAAGLISVSVFRRLVSGYVELLTMSVWQSEQALIRFLESCPPTKKLSSDNGVIHMEPHVYELVASEQGILETGDTQ